MIRPIPEYTNPVWSPYTKTEIERVQRQSARFIMANFLHFSSVTNMLTDLNIPSLEHCRQYSSIILFYKIIHNLIDLSPVELLWTPEDTTKDFIIFLQGQINTAIHFSLDQ